MFNQKELRDYQEGETFSGYLLLDSHTLRETKAGSNFLNISVQDKTKTLSGNFWDFKGNADGFHDGDVVYLNASVTSYNGKPQLKVTVLRPLTDEDPDLTVEDFKEGAPMTSQEMRVYLGNAINDIHNVVWRKIVTEIYRKFSDKFLVYPAAKNIHHNFRGGLAYHTVSIVRLAKAMCKNYPILNEDLVVAGALLHDVGKTVELSGVDGTEYTFEGRLLGHISIMYGYIVETARELGYDMYQEDVVLLLHMELAHHGKPEFGSPVYPQIPEALLLNELDGIDANMQALTTALTQVKPGEFTDRLFALDNQAFYKEKEDENE